MDVQAIARRIAQDHGVTVLEKDVIETLEKLKAANKKKNTGAGEAQVTPQVPAQNHEVSPITSASAAPTPVPTESPPVNSQSPASNSASPPLPTDSTPLPAGSGAPPAPVKTGSEQPSSLKIPADVKPLPITLIDDLIMQGYNRVGIEKILKENGHSAYRNLIGERLKVVKPAVKGAINPAGTGGASSLSGGASLPNGGTPLSKGGEIVNSPTSNPASTPQDVSSTKTPENMGNSGISGTNVVAPVPAPPVAPLQTSSPLVQTVPPPLPTDLPSLLAAFQQFLASRQQAPSSLPAASEQVNESDSSYDSG